MECYKQSLMYNSGGSQNLRMPIESYNKNFPPAVSCGNESSKRNFTRGIGLKGKFLAKNFSTFCACLKTLHETEF